MTEEKSTVSRSLVVEELKVLAKHRYYTERQQAIFAVAAELITAAFDRPIFNHAVRPGDYEVAFYNVEVQAAKPVVEGDTITVYVEQDGKVWARPDAEFQERFKPKA